jgi:threonine aldolase
LIRRARRTRSLLGGGMRQAGIIAAGALYALDHHISRLAEDHEKARVLADAIRETPGLTLDPDVVDTNIVIFKIAPQLGTAAEFTAKLREQGVLMYDVGRHRIRAVTHLDVTLEQVRSAGELISEIAVGRQ